MSVSLPVQIPEFPVAAVLLAHAGPALLVDATSIIEGNAAAQTLLQDKSWWPQLQSWLLSGQSQGERLSVRITDPATLQQVLGGQEGGRIDAAVVEWLAYPMGTQWLVLGRDVTFDQTLTLALSESRTRLKDMLALGDDQLWETDRAGRFSYISERGLLGWSAAELVGHRPHEFGLVATDSLATPFLAQLPVHAAQLWLRNKDNQLRCLETSALPLQDGNGAWIGVRGRCRDMTDQQEQATALAASRTRERIVSHILRVVRDGLSPDREFLAAARALTHSMVATGCVIYRRQSEGWVPAAQYGAAVPEAAPVLCEATLQRGDALQLTGSGHEWLVCRTQYRRNLNGAIAIWREPGEQSWSSEERHLMEAVAEQLGIVWAQITTQEALIERADRDGLTGLVNQRAFAESVSERLARGSTQAVLLNIDLDNFKTINDHLGHKVGDDVLRQVAVVLQKSVRGGDIAARVGGDEFLLYIERADADGAGAVAARVHEGIAAIAATLPELPKKLGASIGLAPVHKGDTLTTLMQRADATMYKAKRDGKGHTEVAT